uniref:Uncharacterized protein n=1 Tax=Anguilla anguilla TaxID=7936 RepID=A0A0E9T0G7_ANGAN
MFVYFGSCPTAGDSVLDPLAAKTVQLLQPRS